MATAASPQSDGGVGGAPNTSISTSALPCRAQSSPSSSQTFQHPVGSVITPHSTMNSGPQSPSPSLPLAGSQPTTGSSASGVLYATQSMPSLSSTHVPPSPSSYSPQQFYPGSNSQLSPLQISSASSISPTRVDRIRANTSKWLRQPRKLNRRRCVDSVS
jgi:hypothetical protein